MSPRGCVWLLLAALLGQVLLPWPALARGLCNAYLPVVPALPSTGEDRCQLSLAYGMASQITSYGPAMGCQWGRRTTFLLDWSLVPGHLEEGTEAPRFGGLGHLGLGLKVDLLRTPTPSELGLGWSLQGKALGAAATFEQRQFAPQLGGQFGTQFSVTHPMPGGVWLSWAASSGLVLLRGDLDSNVKSAYALDLVDLGLLLAVHRQGRPTSLLGTVGALLDASEGAWISWWFSLGVLF